MSSITLNRIGKRYGRGEPALDDVSLHVADGELLVLVGPSGCGKSTLLHIIAGLDGATTGEVRIDGEDVSEKAPRERGLAMVFQNYALYPHLSAFENIAFPLRLSGMRDEREIRRKVEETARLLELERLLARKPRELSGGQRQRVAMGRAIVRDARAFLFDEPLSNLDARLRGQMRTEIARLQRRLRVTTVYVTHDQTEAMTLGDRVAVLRRGRLQQVAAPRELYEEPANLFVAGFIGSPPMNFVPARRVGRRLELPFAQIELGEADARSTAGLEVLIAGIRPQSFEEASSVTDRATAVTFRATVDVTEWLGDVQYAYVPYEAPSEIRARIDELTGQVGESLRTQLVLALDPRSRVREGEEAVFRLDPSRVVLFDPASGANLRSRSQ